MSTTPDFIPHPDPEVQEAREFLARTADENLYNLDLLRKAHLKCVSTWLAKAGAPSRCQVCDRRAAAGGRGLCKEHLDWKFIFRHHSWHGKELRDSMIDQIRAVAGFTHTTTDTES